jgi:hypothetical protein
VVCRKGRAIPRLGLQCAERRSVVSHSKSQASPWTSFLLRRPTPVQRLPNHRVPRSREREAYCQFRQPTSTWPWAGALATWTVSSGHAARRGSLPGHRLLDLSAPRGSALRLSSSDHHPAVAVLGERAAKQLSCSFAARGLPPVRSPALITASISPKSCRHGSPCRRP